MDTITAIALSLDSPAIKAVGLLLDNIFIYAVILIAVVTQGERKDERRMKILFSLGLTLLVVLIFQSAIARERPCTGGEGCPPTYSFPSLHAAMAFTLMSAAIRKDSYWLYLLFALFVSFTRLNLGMHYFIDIAGALPVGLLSYYATHLILEDKRGNSNGPRA